MNSYNNEQPIPFELTCKGMGLPWPDGANVPPLSETCRLPDLVLSRVAQPCIYVFQRASETASSYVKEVPTMQAAMDFMQAEQKRLKRTQQFRIAFQTPDMKPDWNGKADWFTLR